MSNFKDTGLIELIVQTGRRARIDKLPEGIKKDPEAVAETITNNMRKVIIDERALNPKYYDKMSAAARRPHRAASQGGAGLQGVPRQTAGTGTRSSARVSLTPTIRRGPTTVPRRRSSTSSSPRRDLAIEVDRSYPANQARLLGRQPDEGAEGQASASTRRCPADFDRFDELFELVKARDEYR